MSKLSRVIGAGKLAFHAKSPTLLVVGGVVAMGAAAVLACKATLKLEDTLESNQNKLDVIETTGNPDQRDQAKIELVLEVGKIYLAPVSIFLLGAVMTFKGHSMMQQRNAALALAFTTLKKSFDGYRARVVAEQGHESDQRFMSGSKAAVISRDGYPMNSLTRDWDASGKGPYDRVFSNETTQKWVNDLGANKHFVAGQQRFAQQLLNHQGYIYLSDVYKSLGLAINDVSQTCGWKIITLPDGTRNIPIVDFGIDKPLADDWKYNQERAIYLEFNCQGLICGGRIQKAIEEYVA